MGIVPKTKRLKVNPPFSPRKEKINKILKKESKPATKNEGNMPWDQEHGKRKLQEIGSDNVHHGPQLHKVLLWLNLENNVKPHHTQKK